MEVVDSYNGSCMDVLRTNSFNAEGLQSFSFQELEAYKDAGTYDLFCEVDKASDHKDQNFLSDSCHVGLSICLQKENECCLPKSPPGSVNKNLHTYSHTPMSQKRKPEQNMADFEESHTVSLHLYHLTLSKLLSSPPRRVEPPLYRSVVMRNTLKHLEYRMSTHSPSKRIYLDVDGSAALNNLHLSTEVPLTPEANQLTKYNKLFMPSVHQDMSSQPIKQCQSFSSFLDVNKNSDNSTLSSQQNRDLQSPMSMDITENNVSSLLTSCATASLEKITKYSSFSDMGFQSLVNCSEDQYKLVESARASSPAHIDELDNIMQVLVGM